MDSKPKPKPKVKLSGEDGNAFNIIAIVMKALEKAGYTPDEINQFAKEATSGDYDNVLQTAMKWCEVE